jgi:hypothetical protein
MKIGAVGVGLVMLLAVKSARAEDDELVPAEPVPVTISGLSAGTSVRVVEGDSLRPVVTCPYDCRFNAPPGGYRLYFRDPRTGKEQELGVRVREATKLRLERGDPSTRRTGLVLGIVGPVLLGVGAALIAPALLSDSVCRDGDSNCETPGERTAALIGLGVAAVGGVLTPIGWTMFKRGRTKLIDEGTQREAASTSSFQLRVGLSAAPGCYGLGAVGTF